jgi:hypothetical protein
MLRGELEYSLKDEGLIIVTDKRRFKIEFEESRFRPSDVPILLSNINKIKELGFESNRSLLDIIQDQINHSLISKIEPKLCLTLLHNSRAKVLVNFAFSFHNALGKFLDIICITSPSNMIMTFPLQNYP